MRGRGRLLVIGTSLALLAACGSSAAAPDPNQLLRDGKSSIDSAPAVHFTLTSQGVTGTGTLITGGQGDARRPDSFAGSLSVVAGGFPGHGERSSPPAACSTRRRRSARRTTRPTRARTASVTRPSCSTPPMACPACSPSCTGAANAAADLLNGEQLDEVACSIPGTLVAKLLTSADASQPVQATVGVDASSHQLRRVALVGPFFDKAHPSTFTVVLDKYGENVTITPPAGLSGRRRRAGATRRPAAARLRQRRRPARRRRHVRGGGRAAGDHDLGRRRPRPPRSRRRRSSAASWSATSPCCRCWAGCPTSTGARRC